MKVKEKLPEALLVFITPPSMEELKRRLIGRGTETMEVISSRILRAYEEAQGMEDYDYLVINDTLDECVERMHQIIQSEHYRMERNTEFINKIKGEAL